MIALRPNILITGPRQVGKSTLVRNCLAEVPGLKPGGFVTEPVAGAEFPVYQLRDLTTGETRIFARPNPLPPPKFQVDSDVFDFFGCEILQRALEIADLIVMDEIGVLEQTAEIFQQQILACLAANTPVLAVVKARENFFLARLKVRADCSIIKLNPVNRHEFYSLLVDWLRNISAN